MFLSKNVFMAAAVAAGIGSAMALSNPADASSKQSHLHIASILFNWPDTPGGKGLLGTAENELAIALEHARLAASNQQNLHAMKEHIGHVVHAVDPNYWGEGPGLGYGLIRASMQVASEIRKAADTFDASAAVKTHAIHISAASGNAASRGERILGLAQRVKNATSAEEAAQSVKAILDELTFIKKGFDVDGDGEVAWAAPEGGLKQARAHIDLLLKAEGF